MGLYSIWIGRYNNSPMQTTSHQLSDVSIKMSPNVVHKGPINNKPAFVQEMAWCRTGYVKFSVTTNYKFHKTKRVLLSIGELLLMDLS